MEGHPGVSKTTFLKKFLGSTGDLLGTFLCNRLSFWRGSRVCFRTFWADFFSTGFPGRNGAKWPGEAAAVRIWRPQGVHPAAAAAAARQIMVEGGRPPSAAVVPHGGVYPPGLAPLPL